MNLIRATGKLLKNTHCPVKFQFAVRGAYLDKDWMPGPYPKTEAERLAAAKKYNLLPEEYEPYDPEKWEFTYGDYPNLPCRDWHCRDPYYDYDYFTYRLNYGEPIPVMQEMYTYLRDPLEPEVNFKTWEYVFLYSVCIGLVYLYCYLTQYTFETITRFKPRHLLYPGRVHYHYPSSNLEKYK